MLFQEFACREMKLIVFVRVSVCFNNKLKEGVMLLCDFVQDLEQ
jgi:hypothetical protein